MSKKIRVVLILFIIIMIPFSFIVKRIIAIEYQSEAIKLFYNTSGNINFNQTKALEKIDNAIWLAPRNYLFYGTKAQMLQDLGFDRLALIELKKIDSIKDDYAEGFTGQGIIYDLLNKSDSAVIQYNKALECYNFRISKSKKNSFELKSAEINRIFIYLLLQDSLMALAEYERLNKIYPEEPVLDFFKSFNKENYLRNGDSD